MSTERDQEEQDIIKGDEVLENIYNTKKEFLQSEWASNFFTNVNLMKSVYNAELEKKDKALQATVKLLQKSGISMEEISNTTKLSIEKMQELLNKNQD